ncbi:MAG TPA: DUF6152 family protein [Gammaproteobacteria bacterium]
MRLRSLSVLGPAALLLIGPAAAHHSFSAIFDAAQPVELTGTVTRVEWMNPHVWIYLSVAKDDGAVEEWALEMGSPNRLMRYGWHQSSLPEGQTVTITGSRARDGSLKAAVDTVTLPGGQRLFGAQER